MRKSLAEQADAHQLKRKLAQIDTLIEYILWLLGNNAPEGAILGGGSGSGSNSIPTDATPHNTTGIYDALLHGWDSFARIAGDSGRFSRYALERHVHLDDTTVPYVRVDNVLGLPEDAQTINVDSLMAYVSNIHTWMQRNDSNNGWIPLKTVLPIYANFPNIPSVPTLISCKGQSWYAEPGYGKWAPMAKFTTHDGTPGT